MSSEKTKALINKSAETKNDQNKFAEEATAFGQLVGAGFNYEVFEKEGAPLGQFIRGGAKKLIGRGKSLGGKIIAGAKTVPGKAHKKIVGLGQKATLKAGLYMPGKGGVKRNVAAGYGLIGAGAGAGGAGVVAAKNALNKKQAEDAKADKKAAEKIAAEKPVTADNYILRYTNEEEA